MWNFDFDKTSYRRKCLEEYYRKEGLNACEFSCGNYKICSESQRERYKKQYIGGTCALMPFYDVSYNGIPIRVLVVGKETGYMKNEKYGTAKNFEENSLNVLNCIGWEKKNNHIKGTLYILQNIFNIHTEYVYSSYALTNLLRCSFQNETVQENVSATHDTAIMRKMCINHLIQEIKILEPTIIIVQGEWATKGCFLIREFEKVFGKSKSIMHNSNRKYGLYEFEEFDCMLTHHPAILGNWVKNLAPDSVWPMLDYLRNIGRLPIICEDSGLEYEKKVRPIVDEMISRLPSNDRLRGNIDGIMLKE